MNVKELNLKYAIVNDAAPFKYRLWKNNKVVKTGSTDKDSEQAMTQWANGTGVAWDKVTLHDPKWKQLKVAKNQNSSSGSSSSVANAKKETATKERNYNVDVLFGLQDPFNVQKNYTVSMIVKGKGKVDAEKNAPKLFNSKLDLDVVDEYRANVGMAFIELGIAALTFDGKRLDTWKETYNKRFNRDVIDEPYKFVKIKKITVK